MLEKFKRMIQDYITYKKKILFIALYCAWYFRMWKNVPDGQSVRYVH